MNWQGLLGKRMDLPGHFLARNVSNGHVDISGRSVLNIQILVSSSKGLGTLGIPRTAPRSSLSLRRTQMQRCKVEVDPGSLFMIYSLSIVDTDNLIEKQKLRELH